MHQRDRSCDIRKIKVPADRKGANILIVLIHRNGSHLKNAPAQNPEICIAVIEEIGIQRHELAPALTSGLANNSGQRGSVRCRQQHEVEAHWFAELAQLIFNCPSCRFVITIGEQLLHSGLQRAIFAGQS